MHGLPSDIDLSFFANKTLVQVCFGEHDLLLNFSGQPSDSAVSISIESTIGLRLPEGKRHVWEDLRQGAGFLVSLVSNTVARTKGTTDGTMTIEFKEGPVLEIYDNSKQFESYVIRHGDETIVV